MLGEKEEAIRNKNFIEGITKQKYWKTDEEEEFQTEMMEVEQRDEEKEGDEGIEGMKKRTEKPEDFLESNKAF